MSKRSLYNRQLLLTLNPIMTFTAGDETVSMVSDTWSTDVLASDSENIDHNQSANSANINSVLSSSGALAMFQNANFPQVSLLRK